ncbi:NERD domain-containing protein [Nitrospirillum iridis]|uniref:Cbb3-type cytochrome oxidase subunit 3 n=1 Tax=Nitrospirillum iridis TaxID=765888 RepID=A0A7X0EEQ9_9PROT|nr:NERD domain-containing protein [Nitrospirillum iridis]MBB6254172.1 cbb3-type cytochrome oxidase subunit 3 [Nitrospirillum iridis]
MAQEISDQAPQAAPLMGISQMVTIGTVALVVIVLMLVVMWALRPKTRTLSRRRYNAEAYRRKLALDDAGYSVVHGLHIRDKKGKPLRVDHLIRLPASVLMVLSSPPDMGGRISAQTKAGQWRYLAANGKVGFFVNPVIQVQPLIHIMKARFPMVRLRVLVVFPDGTDFTSGVPRTACLANDFLATLKAMAREDGTESEAMAEAWEPLAKALGRSGGNASAPEREEAAARTTAKAAKRPGKVTRRGLP